jgi:hypothetical protein
MLVAWPTCQWIPVAVVVGGIAVVSITKFLTERKKFWDNSAGSTFKVQTATTNVLIDPPVHAGTVGIRLAQDIWVGI